MLEVLRVLVDEKTFVSFNLESRVDPQYLRGLFPGLLKLSQLGTGGRKAEMGPLHIGRARYAFAEKADRLPIAVEHVICIAHKCWPLQKRLQRIKALVCFQHLDSPCGLARTH